MPDENKLRALNLAGYRIRLTCGNCSAFRAGQGCVGSDRAAWGRCTKITYDGGKRVEQRRRSRVHASGWCGQHQVNIAATETLGDHAQFLLEVPGFDGPARNIERFWAKPGHARKLHLFGPDIMLGDYSACEIWGANLTEGKARFYAPTRDQICQACLKKSPKAQARLRRAEEDIHDE